MIPKILHKIWIGDKENDCQYSDHWLEFFPDYELKYWDNESIKPYALELNELLGDADITIVTATDIFRLMILRDYGGIYMDHDIEVLRDMRHLFKGSEAYVTFHFPPNDKVVEFKPGVTMRDVRTKDFNELVVKTTEFEGRPMDNRIVVGGDYINNCFIASIPNSKFVNDALNVLIENYKKPAHMRLPQSDWTAGPSGMAEPARNCGITLNGETQTNELLTAFNCKHLHPVFGPERLYALDKFNKDLASAYVRDDCYSIHHQVFANSDEFIATLKDDALYSKHVSTYLPWFRKYVV